MSNPASATLDFASLLSDNPSPARVTILDPKEAYNPETKTKKQKPRLTEDPSDVETTRLVRKLVSQTPTYNNVVGATDIDDDVISMVRSWPKQHLDWKMLDPSFHEVTMGNWEDKIEWDGVKKTKPDKEEKPANPEESTALALLAQPRNADLDNLVFDDNNISWDGSRQDNIEKAIRIPLILELGIAGQSVARQVLPVSRPTPFDQTEPYAVRFNQNWTAQTVTSTADSRTLHTNKKEREKEIAERQKKRAQMALDKTSRVTEAMGTLEMGGGTGRTITSSLMGPGGTERTGRPTRGHAGSTATHDAEYIEQLDLVYNHIFSKPELSLVELRQQHRPKLPLSFVRRDRTWQFQIRYVPAPKKSDTNSYMSVQAGATSQSKLRNEADLNPTEGNLIMLEYCEERPPIMLNKGHGSKMVNYYRGDKSRCPVSAGGGDRPVRRKRADNVATTTAKDNGPSGKVERPPRLKGPVVKTTLEDWIGKAPKRKREEQGEKHSIDILPEGVTEILHPKVHGPFLGEVEEGVTQTGLITNIFCAPLFRHEPESTDFLMILGKRGISASKRSGFSDKMSVVLRPLPASIFTVGQVEPRERGLVHAPQTSGEKSFLQNFVSYHIAKQLTFYERHEGRGLKFDEIVGMWAGSGIQNNSLRQRIKVVAEYDKNTQIWESKPVTEYDYPGVEVLGRKIAPEGIACYETACAATRHLQDIGIHMLYVGSGAPVQAVGIALLYIGGQMQAAKDLSRRMKNAANRVGSSKNASSSQVAMYEKASLKLEDLYKELKRKAEVAKFIFEELCLAPWHWTFEFIDIHKHAHGSGQMQLQGLEFDPSGGSGGFNFLRDTEKAKASKATGGSSADGDLKERIKKITGTDNDLRKLTMKQMGQMLRSFGMSNTKIDTLKRWDRVHVIRDLSTKAASDGMGDGLERFARGEKLKLSEQKQDYQKRIQEIWRRQRTVLSTDIRQGGPAGDGAGDDDDGAAAIETASPVKKSKEKVLDTSDDSDDDDAFAAELGNFFEDDKTGNQLLASQRREGDEGGGLSLQQQDASQDLAKEARDLAALRRQNEEEKATQDGLDMTTPVRRNMIGKKVVRKRVTKTYPDGRHVTTFKFILSEDEVDKVIAKQREEEISGEKMRKKKLIHQQNDQTYGHAMFEEDDNYELASTDYGRSRTTKGRKGGLKGTKGRRPLSQQGTKIKSKLSTDKRMKKRRREMEEAELYVPPSKRKTTNNRRERGSGRQRLPHVVFSTRLEKIRLDVERFPGTGPFLRPVDRRKFPQYYEKISVPIDLQTIRDKNQKFQYKIADTFLKEFQLMKSNAEKFNGLNHPLAQEANRIYDYVKHTVDAHRDELTAMELALQDMTSGKKKKKSAGKASGSKSGGEMVDGLVVGNLNFSDSDSDDSGTELIEIG